MQSFAESVVVITGAAGNLGRALAASFATRGARLALLDRNLDGIQQVIEDLPEGAQATAFAIDLLDAESVAATFAQVVESLGPIDVLANIAGGFSMGPKVEETADKDWDLMLNLNARSVFYCCRAAIPSMLKEGGSIINVSARAALDGKGSMGPYCASKAAVKTLTESLAAENKLRGIRVNCILPGTIDTPENRSSMPNADHSTWVPTSALADVVIFLASKAARCVTGAAIPVYGKTY